MVSETTGNMRTLIGYATDLLKYPRFVIERDVDFTNCLHAGRHDESLAACTECQFGDACYWLNQHRMQTADDATLDEFVEAIKNACLYMQVRTRQ